MEGGGDPEFFNGSGPFRGVKRDLYEGGIRVPMIVRYPNHIKAGSTSDHMSAFWDIIPTLADLTHFKLPANVDTDGISSLPCWIKENKKNMNIFIGNSTKMADA